VIEMLLKAGALDVYLAQVIMKKGRPGIVLTVLCDEERLSHISDILFQETTTIGIRFHRASRITLERDLREGDTGLGPVRVKAAHFSNGKLRFTPEYEDCRKIALKNGVPLIDVMRRAAQMKVSEPKRRHPKGSERS
jgi:pyridinium-3,5-bisthiocarboxylic acid mononucleotide nickel chelatase